MTLHKTNIADYVGGWFIGGFEPSLLSTHHFEVGLKSYTAGAREPIHYQLTAKEYTLVISGRCLIGDLELGPGDILTIDPQEAAGFEALEDVVLVAIKVPSIPGDKQLGTPT